MFWNSILLVLFIVFSSTTGQSSTQNIYPDLPVLLGDPYILNDGDTYYLYGTNSPDGINVYQSTDLKHWTGPCGATGSEVARRWRQVDGWW